MKRQILLAGALLVSLLLSACSTTKLVRVWRDDASLKKYDSILVIGLFKKEDVRESIESEFVRQLKAAGVDARASYPGLSQEMLLDEEKVVAFVKKSDVQAVLAVRFIGLKDKQEIEKYNTYRLPYAYYSKVQTYLRESELHTDKTEQNVRYGIIVAEANLYDVKTENLVWSAVSDTYLQDAAPELRRSFAGVLVKRLVAEKII